MGKPYCPPSESFCLYVFKALVKRLESDLEFYKAENSITSKKRSSKSDSVVKLLNCSNLTLCDDWNLQCDFVKEGSFNEHQSRLTNYDIDTRHVFCYVHGYEEIPVSREDLHDGKVRETVSSSFRDHVYKKLTERLENEIKLSSKTNTSRAPRNSTGNNGILLLNSAKYPIQNEHKPQVINKKRKRILNYKSDSISRTEKLIESTVDSEWVLSKTGTEGWCETKRAKIIRLKLLSTLSDGAKHCKEIQ